MGWIKPINHLTLLSLSHFSYFHRILGPIFSGLLQFQFKNRIVCPDSELVEVMEFLGRIRLGIQFTFSGSANPRNIA
jgi:hypothetical protein